jgi:serine phosphatase RsbU (regulator of sigma subunit)
VDRDALVPLVLELDGQPPFLLLAVLRRHLARSVQATDAQLWLADYEERELTRLSLGEPAATTERAPIDGGARGRAYRAHEVEVADAGGGRTVAHVPVAVRAERLGVLDVELPAAPDREQVDHLRALGSALGYVLLAARRYTDLFEAVRRRRDLELPAELQWELLPVLAHDGPDFAIAGRLEPAYDIGGDNFDYAVDGEGVTVAITDAMGHGTRAALLSTLVVGVQRNVRRHGEGIRQQARSVNTVVHDQFGGDVYATGQLLRLHRADGAYQLINGGHGPIYLLRGEHVREMVLEPDLPFGMFPDTDYHLHDGRLEAGDRLVLISDGILEATPDGGEQFGEARLRDVIRSTAAMTPVEMVRTLTARCMAHREGFLRDDATAVCIDYRRRQP